MNNDQLVAADECCLKSQQPSLGACAATEQALVAVRAKLRGDQAPRYFQRPRVYRPTKRARTVQ